MAGNFVSDSWTYLRNASPTITAVPFTVGMWVNLSNTGNSHTLFCLADTAGINNFFEIQKDFGGTLAITARATTQSSSNLATNMVANTWNFIVGRFISATNRRLTCLYNSGLIEHVQNVTSRVPAGIDSLVIGAELTSTLMNVTDGLIGEWWITKTDIQPDGAQLSNSTLHQLARSGPFSMPHIAKDIIEYRSLWSGLASNEDKPGEVYWGDRGRQTWTNVGGVTIGAHPPLYPDYVRPGQIIRPLVI